jgi:hypothetical protein
MKKFWMMGGAVIAVSVAAMVWNAGPVRSAENLLARAQSEFAAKARDALIQRQMAQATMAPLAIAVSKTDAPSPYVVASLDPVAAPAVATREIRFEAPAPEPQAAVEPQTVTVASVEPQIALPAAVSGPAPAPTPAAEETPATKLQVAALEEPKSSVLPKQIDVAPVSEAAKAETRAVTRTSAEPRRQFKAERKTRHVQRERRTNDVYRAERPERFERRAPRYATPYNLEALRARSPELAAAIARYM